MSVKLPAEIHRQQGTYQPSRHKEPPKVGGAPVMPEGMDPISRFRWEQIVRDLTEAGLASRIDAVMLRALCESLTLYEAAQDHLVCDGIITTGHTGRVGPSPWFEVRTKALDQIMRICKAFGMTPAARAGLGNVTNNESDDDSDIDSILNFKIARTG